jgi:hypothetical protein
LTGGSGPCSLPIARGRRPGPDPPARDCPVPYVLLHVHLQGRRHRRGLGTAGTSDKLRQPAIGLRRPGGRDRPAAGHSSTRTTEVIYRKELRPVLVKGAEVMDQIFG